MTRPLPKFSAAAALLAAIGLTCFWPCTHFKSYRAHWSWRTVGVDIATAPGAVNLEWLSHNYRSPWSWDCESVPPYPRNATWAGTAWSRHGFAAGSMEWTTISGGLGPFITTTRFLVVPLWAMAVPTWAAAVALFLARRTRSKHLPSPALT